MKSPQQSVNKVFEGIKVINVGYLRVSTKIKVSRQKKKEFKLFFMIQHVIMQSSIKVVSEESPFWRYNDYKRCELCVLHNMHVSRHRRFLFFIQNFFDSRRDFGESIFLNSQPLQEVRR